VAVKLLRDEYAQDRSLIGRFRVEARHAAAVAHPGIASVFDYGEAPTAAGAEPTAFLVMELVDGEPLSALLAREGRLGLARSLDIVGQAAVALGAAHRAGLVHRDIKPANLLVRPDGLVKVTDFGAAQALDSQAGHQHQGLLGTAGYLSPEQATGQPLTPATDVYALGVVAYEYLAGGPFWAAIRSQWRSPTCCRRHPHCPRMSRRPSVGWWRRRWPRTSSTARLMRRCSATNCWRCGGAGPPGPGRRLSRCTTSNNGQREQLPLSRLEVGREGQLGVGSPTSVLGLAAGRRTWRP
jgi:serine/threonine protein kinase